MGGDEPLLGRGELFGGGVALEFEVGTVGDGVVDGGVRSGDLGGVAAAVEGPVVFGEHVSGAFDVGGEAVDGAGELVVVVGELVDAAGELGEGPLFVVEGATESVSAFE